MHWEKGEKCCAFHKNYYSYIVELDFQGDIAYNKFTIINAEVLYMLKIPELAMPRSQTVTTVCNGKREVWSNYEQAKSHFLEMMMSSDGEEHERYECIYIQLTNGLDECSDE